MNEERRMILEMLREGAISIEEAERLLEAVPADGGFSETALRTVAPSAESGARGVLSPKRIIVLVSEGGKPKVNVRIPFSLLRIGLKLGKSFGSMGLKNVNDEQSAQAFEMLQSLDIDELLNSVDDGEITLPYTIVDVEDAEKGEHVLIVIE